MTKETLQIALEALTDFDYDKRMSAIESIKEALETKDEPVGKFAKFTDGIWKEVTDYSAGIPLYTTPQRTWVGLTDEEIAEVEDEYIVDYRIPAGSAWNFAKDIEAKLKEKNT